MRAAQVISVFAALLVAGCGGTDPGRNDNTSGAGGDAGTMAGNGGGAGSMAGSGGDAGSEAGSGGMAGSAGSQAGSGGMPAGEGSFFPLATGNTWTFQVTEAGIVTTKVQTIGDLEPVGGTGPNKDAMAYRAVTEKADGGDMTVSWQIEVDGKNVRYREQSYMASTGDLELEEHWDPYKLRVDDAEEHTIVGATWTETYSETKLPVGMAPSTVMASDTWRVIAVDEEVQVPAGTFDALVIDKTGATSTKRYWFVRGIGKVKETGTQTEELVSYEIVE